MVNAITEARTDVAWALNAVQGLTAYAYVPERLNAPAAVVRGGSPYVTPGQVLGEYQIGLSVRLFMANGTNEVMTEGLDALIVSVCEALRGYGVVSVSTPGVDADSYGTPYLTVDITINTTYRNEDNYD